MVFVCNVFPKYTLFEPQISVRQISPSGVSAIHRFYDTSPVSPSGLLIAYTEFDFEDRLPNPGDEASVVVLNLATGAEVFRTRTIAWDTQLGAQVQWGVDDSELFFNRMRPENWMPHAVKVDPKSGAERTFKGPVYVVSPDGRTLLSPSLTKIWNVQRGYGVIVPADARPLNRGFPSDDGLYATDMVSGESKLAISFRDIYEQFPEEFAPYVRNSQRGGMYGFHVKYSPDGELIMFIIRWLADPEGRAKSRNWIITMKSDFSQMRIALGPNRWEGGHHPNWCPDSRHIVMNLMFKSRRTIFPRVAQLIDRVARRFRVTKYKPAYVLRFAKFEANDSEPTPLSTNHVGSGHPTVNALLNVVLADAYPWESVAVGDGTSPIRLLDLSTDILTDLVRIQTKPSFYGPQREWRVDPHPAWDRAQKVFVFNGISAGKRAVFVGDMSRYYQRG